MQPNQVARALDPFQISFTSATDDKSAHFAPEASRQGTEVTMQHVGVSLLCAYTARLTFSFPSSLCLSDKKQPQGNLGPLLWLDATA